MNGPPAALLPTETQSPLKENEPNVSAIQKRTPKSALLIAAGVATVALVIGSGISVFAQNGMVTQPQMNNLEQAELLKAGEANYTKHCAGCHGVNGDGHGPASRWLNPKPRDFRDGVFKFRSTPSGSLPTEGDLMRTLTAGLVGTSMPSWHLVPERERYALVKYIKTFSTLWEDPTALKTPISLPPAPENLNSPESVYAGRLVYEKNGCVQCHGDGGQGDGPSANALNDQWGFHVKPANFVRGRLRGGDTPTDIYRTFTTGVNGTPMPAYKDDLTEEQRWDLVSYVSSLRRGETPHPANPAGESAPAPAGQK